MLMMIKERGERRMDGDIDGFVLLVWKTKGEKRCLTSFTTISALKTC